MDLAVTHRIGHQPFATLGLMAGFALMMVLDTTLGYSFFTKENRP